MVGCRNNLVLELDNMSKLAEKSNIQVPVEVLKWAFFMSFSLAFCYLKCLQDYIFFPSRLDFFLGYWTDVK